ncbi:MAG: 50S ribosomal protein L11 methyltransferase [Dehalococcoidia bacterium]
MTYIEIIASVQAGDTERAADVLRAHTGAGVWTEAPFVQPDLESEALPADGDVRIHAYVPAEAARNGHLDALRDALAAAGLRASVEERSVQEEDWAEAWKAYFDVERYGKRIVVVPSWRAYEPRRDDVVIALDPGMAFGTGQHETTRMCLEALEGAVRPGDRVLDVGCGSGILAIAAAKLGAGAVVAVDIDETAVRVTAENARANGVEAAVRAGTGSMGEAWPFDDAAREFDVVVANIVAGVIMELAAALADALTPGGRLIASGIIAARERETADALAAAGLRIEEVRAMGEWRCIEAVRA